MTLNDQQLEELAALAVEAATAAGALIFRHRGASLAIQQKLGGDTLASQVVTEIDHASQLLICNALEPSCQQYDLGMLAEEDVDDGSRFQKAYFWCIDPLDGTLPFVEGSDGFAVSIALVSRLGVPIIGVLCNPVTGDVCHAIQGRGATMNDHPWMPGAKSHFGAFTLFCDRSLLRSAAYPELHNQLAEASGALGASEFRVVSHGGAVMNAWWTMANEPACYLKPPKKALGGGSIWDYAATACVAREIGAVASDAARGALDLNRSDSTFMNHRGILYTSSPRVADALAQFNALT